VSTESIIGIFAFSFVASFGAVISPGPVSAAIVTESPRQGWLVGPLIAGGHTFLELLMVILISLGLAKGIATPQVRMIIAVVGGLVLLGIGLSYVLSAWKGTIQLPKPDHIAEVRAPLSLIWLGAITTISNPFWYTWWVTVAAGYLAQAQAISAAAVGSFYLGHISADFAWDTTLAIASSTGRRWLTNRQYQILILLTGGFMLYLGALFLTNAIQSLKL
jgi:threonine/homoserine/homoserine lactone efflux protein